MNGATHAEVPSHQGDSDSTEEKTKGHGTPAHFDRIPAEGVSRDALLAHLKSLRAGDADWRNAKTWSLVYHASDEHKALLDEAHKLFAAENALNPMAFKSLKHMEADVVRMVAALFHGDANTVGTMTSGGTESLLLSVKTYRDRARKLWPWIRSPEMVLPETAHAAFDKAAHYFGVKAKYARVDEDGRVDLTHYRRLIGPNTVMLVASAPQYPHGIVDPIESISAIAVEKKLPLHVDACVGGFVLPWIEKLGSSLPAWDFRSSGVTSISADLHKYGYAAKGASIILYRSMEDLQHQFFISTNWSGGIYLSPSMPGTRPGGTIAAAWAALQGMGESGYLSHTARALDATARLKAGIANIHGLKVIGDPQATLLAWTSTEKDLDTYAIADVLEERGWHVDRQQRPASVHCTVTSNHVGVVDQYLADLAEAVLLVSADPSRKSQGNAAMYGMMAKVPVRGLVKSAVLDVMKGLYGPTGEMADPTKNKDGLVNKLVAKYGDRMFDVYEKVEGRLAPLRRVFSRGSVR
jgi:glutamate/tyrosine decarboxylase-like PLP-dependent enzyme